MRKTAYVAVCGAALYGSIHFYKNAGVNIEERHQARAEISGTINPNILTTEKMLNASTKKIEETQRSGQDAKTVNELVKIQIDADDKFYHIMRSTSVPDACGNTLDLSNPNVRREYDTLKTNRDGQKEKLENTLMRLDNITAQEAESTVSRLVYSNIVHDKFVADAQQKDEMAFDATVDEVLDYGLSGILFGGFVGMAMGGVRSTFRKKKTT